MVIHDMRNPTNSIEFALKEVISKLQAAADKHNSDVSKFKSTYVV
jgi:hypothetical protein